LIPSLAQSIPATLTLPSLFSSQIAAFFSAPPHDILSSRFFFYFVSADGDPSSDPEREVGKTGRQLIAAVPNRVHFFSLKESGAKWHGGVSARGGVGGVHWIQLIVER
jgi:hypothetical protein